MSLVKVDYIGEGTADAAVARRLIAAAGADLGQDFCTPRRGRGKNQLDSRIAGLNNRARQGHIILVLRDLDHDTPCPGALRQKLISAQDVRLCLRIAVRSVEAWLLADHAAFAKAIGVAAPRVATAPDSLHSPKQHVTSLATQSGRSAIRRDILPVDRSGRDTGPGYHAWLIDFIEQHWDPVRAAKSGRSPSLTRALSRLTETIAASDG